MEANKPDYYRLDEYKYYESPFYEWLKDHVVEMVSLNFILSIIFLFILSKVIRNWRGIAEN
jgi:hypothetical protein